MGINGQIGSYLYEILHNKNYRIYGIVRTIPQNKLPGVTYLKCDLSDQEGLKQIIISVHPDEIYNMAAQTDALISISQPEETMWVNTNIVVTLCEMARQYGFKLFQSGSIEIYKGLNLTTIDENTLSFYPKNPYAISKLASHWMVRYYREQHGCYMVNGIIFNAESPRRKETYVTRKITLFVRKIFNLTGDPQGLDKIENLTGSPQALDKILNDPDYVLTLGNLDAERDWIHASDVAMAAWMSLQHNVPQDYIIGLGTNHSVRTFIEKSFAYVGITIIWKGKFINEIGIDDKTGRILVRIDPSLFRQYETKTVPLHGDNTQLKSIGWVPKYTLDDIIHELIDYQ